MEKWLVRTHQNLIAGPYARQELIDLIQEGRLSEQDEVCEENHYWIYLYERDELLNQLGIEFPHTRSRPDDEEVTETETETLVTDPIPESEPPPLPDDDTDIPDLPTPDRDLDHSEQTRMYVQSDHETLPKGYAVIGADHSRLRSQKELTTLWRIGIGVLFLVVAFLFFWILKKLS